MARRDRHNRCRRCIRAMVPRTACDAGCNPYDEQLCLHLAADHSARIPTRDLGRRLFLFRASVGSGRSGPRPASLVACVRRTRCACRGRRYTRIFFRRTATYLRSPFLILLAVKGSIKLPDWATIFLFVPLFVASAVVDFKQASTVREDWATPAHQLASREGSCTYIWSPDLLKYLQIYEPNLTQCDLSTHPSEILYVTTRYSPLASPPEGYDKIRSERVGVAEIALYRLDASLKTYGLSRFIFRP